MEEPYQFWRKSEKPKWPPTAILGKYDEKACVSRNCDTNTRIKFIFDTAIDDLEWKNPIDFGENRKTNRENMKKKLVHSIT